MKKIFRKTVAGLAASALAAGALTAPQATAEEPKTTDVNLPLACYVYPKGRAAGLRTSLDFGNDFALSMKATAPETVEVGDEFEYVIDPGTVVLPTEMKALGQTVEAKYISQANLWIDLPDNVELISFDYDKTTPLKFNVLQDGNRLRFVGENRHAKSHTVGPVGFTGKPVGDNPAEWEPGGFFGSNEARWFYGGAQFNAGDTKRGKLPKVTLKLKATGAPGSTAQATIRNADAKNNPPEAFVQGLLNGMILGKTFNGMARCGLSEYYTGKGAMKVPAGAFPAVTIVEKPEPTPEPSPEPSPAESTTSESEPTKESETSTKETKPTEEPKPSTTSTEPTSTTAKPSTTSTEPTKEPESTKESSTPTKEPEPSKESETPTADTTTSKESETSTKETKPSEESETSTTEPTKESESTKEAKPTEEPKPSTTSTEPTKEPESTKESSTPTKEPEPSKESETPTADTTTSKESETSTKETKPSEESETSTTEPTKETEASTETTTTTTPNPQNGSSNSSDGSSFFGMSSDPVMRGLYVAFWVALGLIGLTAFGNWLKQNCDFKWPF
ncbi:hypothetical protein [Corynebacterium tuscaniense]|uniref:hypothetical protein n=1 Tax=Corynebacterium tuscaniense TaxID=302449 RepID=UPI00051024B6|nr:hypothetical protein [Corynebacterium tuscaniense]KGF21665.1 hypothetical protein HMPREF2129_09175 [Corynebacterium tuscaniense DNF00037]